MRTLMLGLALVCVVESCNSSDTSSKNGQDGGNDLLDVVLPDLADTQNDASYDADFVDIKEPIPEHFLAFLQPQDGALVDNPVTFSVRAGAAIVQVVYDADGWEIGQSDSGGNFPVTYGFYRLGDRVVTARGKDAQGNWIAQATLRIRVKTPYDPIRAAEVLAEIQAGPRYGSPTPQDAEGRGIWPSNGVDGRSESVYPPFVLGPRRQVDSMVRQMYKLLPESLRKSTAFVIPDRIAQAPEAYEDYIRSRTRIVIVGNFVGIGTATSDQTWFLDRHELELWMGQKTIEWAQALGIDVVGVYYTMGDSISSYAPTVKNRLQQHLHAMLHEHGLDALMLPVSWGADEMVPVAFAAQLPVQRVRVTYASTQCRHHYDGGKTSPEVMEAKLAELNLVEDAQHFDWEVVVFTNVAGEDGIFPNAASQDALDDAVWALFANYTPLQRARFVIVDARMFNGALNQRTVPTNACDYLAFGSWGTFANKVGTTLAAAKIAFAAQDATTARQWFLEAVAHDVYANGYWDGRDGFIPRLSAAGISFNHFYGYDNVTDVTTVFSIVNTYVNERMQARFAESGCMQGHTIRITPQLWRTFESEVHVNPALTPDTAIAGVYRTDLNPLHFDPTYQQASFPWTLVDLVTE